MIVLSMVVHASFLYGVRVKTQSLDAPSSVALNATIAARALPTPEPIITPPLEMGNELAVEKTALVEKKVAKAPEKKPTPKQVVPVEAAPEPISKTPMPEAAPDIALSPASEKIEPVAEVSSAPAPLANIHERSGAKVRAPTPIENPTMPAEDVVVAEAKVAEEPPPAPTPMPAIATAPHPLEPVGQEGPPRVDAPSIVVSKPKDAPLTAPAVTPPPDKVAVIAPPTVNIDRNALPMPASGEAQYKLRMGIVSGELTLSWKFADGHYRLDSIAQGTGIFAIAGKYVQASEGELE